MYFCMCCSKFFHWQLTAALFVAKTFAKKKIVAQYFRSKLTILCYLTFGYGIFAISSNKLIYLHRLVISRPIITY